MAFKVFVSIALISIVVLQMWTLYLLDALGVFLITGR